MNIIDIQDARVNNMLEDIKQLESTIQYIKNYYSQRICEEQIVLSVVYQDTYKYNLQNGFKGFILRVHDKTNNSVSTIELERLSSTRVLGVLKLEVSRLKKRRRT